MSRTELQGADSSEKKKGGGLLVALLSIALAGTGGYAFYQHGEAAKKEAAIL